MPASSRSKYDLLAVDIDGTLLDSAGRVPAENIGALHRAREAGLRIVLCTGRSWTESRFAIDAISATEAMVSAGGSMVVDTRSGRTLHRFSMPHSVVGGVVDLLTERGLAALVLKDRCVSDHDYLVVTREGAPIDPVSTWWFETLGVRYRIAGSIEEDEHPEWTVRVGACAPSASTLPIRDVLLERFGESVMFHSFPAVIAPEHVKNDGSGGMYHVVEAFDRAAHKWSGIAWLCEQLGVDAARTAAIGDQINDVSMVTHAGLGIAMGNAVDELARVADRRTRSNDEAGLAFAVDRILSGEW